MNRKSGLIAKTAVVLVFSGLTALSGCGRKGSLEEPTAAGTAAQSGAPSASAAGVPTSGEKETKAPPKEDRPFILDGIL